MLTAAEQALADQMIAERNIDMAKPPWMQSHRMRLVRKDAARRIPPRPTVSIELTPTTYHATHRVTGTPVGKHAIHESDGDVPICQLGRHFSDNNIPRVQLGPGPVNCGHCAASNR